MRKLAVVAFGGNALLRSGQKGTYQEQIENVEQTCESLYNLLKRNYNIVIGHGNGPQVGNVMLQHEEGKRAGIEAMPMDFCVAETQGRGDNLGTDENLIWNVYDAKKPFETISLANENYAETSFEFIQMPSSNNPMVLIHYPDGYTGNVRTATLASMTKEEEQKRDEELNVPNTGVFHTVSGVVVASFSISAFVILGTMLIVKKAKK